MTKTDFPLPPAPPMPTKIPVTILPRYCIIGRPNGGTERVYQRYCSLQTALAATARWRRTKKKYKKIPYSFWLAQAY